VPAEDRVGLDQGHHASPRGQQGRREHETDAVPAAQPRTRAASKQHTDLVPQDRVLQDQFAAGSAGVHENASNDARVAVWSQEGPESCAAGSNDVDETVEKAGHGDPVQP
jgi:hypothetical protein